MYFGFSEKISKDLLSKANIIYELSQKAKCFFSDKEYGSDIQTVIIGIICVHPTFDTFLKLYNGYIYSEKTLEFDIKLNYYKFKVSSKLEIYKMIKTTVLDFLNLEKINVETLCLDKFALDFASFMDEISSE